MLSLVVKLLEEAEIPFMLTGSFASSFHGRPRATQDIDMVIDPTGAALEAFSSSLSPEFYVSREAAEEALQRREQFNIIHRASGDKVDLIIRKDRPFSHTEFGRRRRASISGVKVDIASAEDIILAKLEWAKKGSSQLQFRDALGIAEVQRKDLDIDYLKRWGRELQVESLLDKLLEEAEGGEM
jgi:hypothetical protein